MEEIWKPAYNNPEYTVSSSGKVKDEKGRECHYVNIPSASPRLAVNYYINGKKTMISVALLVAHTFNDNPLNCKRIIYIDGDYHNCSAVNLEWKPQAKPVAKRDPNIKKRMVMIQFPKGEDEYWRRLGGYYSLSSLGRIRKDTINEISNCQYYTINWKRKALKFNGILYRIFINDNHILFDKDLQNIWWNRDEGLRTIPTRSLVEDDTLEAALKRTIIAHPREEVYVKILNDYLAEHKNL